jgi:methylated-DNA-[protein]-cysteine S-methyltransferase
MRTVPSAAPHRIVIKHRLTCVTLFAREKGAGLAVAGILFGRHGTPRGRKGARAADPRLRRWASLIGDFLSGNAESLDELPIDLSGNTPFAEAVLLACRSIPYGATVSYARLAALAGRPKAIRAAASVMRDNPFPLAIPCHRVIAKDGTLGGFMGARKGKPLGIKKALLDLEKEVSKKRAPGK